MRIFVIDIGGTKFTAAAFSGDRLIRRESGSTDRGGGPDWMFAQIERIFRVWQEQYEFIPDACGIGFGGPVDFPTQRVGPGIRWWNVCGA
jgi:predicted NBD/HSP70 family sugar kinase